MNLRARNPILILSAILIPALLWGGQSDPQAGTWKMNLDKSTFVPGGPHPKGETVVIEEIDGGIKVASTGVNPDGPPGRFEFSAKYDGNAYPMTGSPAADTVVLRRLDPRTIETIRKKNGQVVTTNMTFISEDGKTRTNVFQGKNAQGEPITWTAVFDKQ
jgi:hypothetical protein